MTPGPAAPALSPPSPAEATIGYAQLLADLEVRRHAAGDIRLRRMAYVPTPHPAP